MFSIRKTIIILLLLSASFHSVSSVAAEFYWTHYSYTQKFASPGDVCHYYRSSVGECQYTACRGESSANNTYILIKNSVSQYQCKYVSQPSGFQYGNLIAIRGGDTCATGSTYNSTSGLCDYAACPVGQKRVNGTCQAEQCPQSGVEPSVYSPAQSKCVKHYNLDKPEWCQYAGQNQFDVQDDQSLVTNDPSGVDQAYDSHTKCGFNVTKKDCTTKTDGTHKCKVSGKYNGQYDPNATKDNIYNCTTSDCQTPPDKPIVDTPTPQNTTDQKPCNYVSVGGSLQCQSSQTTDNEGTKNCGTVNGSWQCVPKAPTSNGIVIDSKVTSQTNPDGSTTTTKTDTATQTKCTNIGICTSKTTTSTTTTNKDPNGNTTSVTGTCKGDNCPDVNTNPDGNGDGFGDCVGDDCGDEGGNASPPTDAELGEVKTFGESTNEFLLRARSAPIVSALADIRAPSGGNCTEYQVDTYLGTLEYDSHCILIEEKRSLITLIVKTLWALLATWIVLG